MPPIKLNPIWGSKRMAALDGRQVRCATFDEGSVWIHELDDLPLPVRRRLAESVHNICPTCVGIDTRRNGTPSIKLYFAVIDAIERTLDRAEQRFISADKLSLAERQKLAPAAREKRPPAQARREFRRLRELRKRGLKKASC